MTAAACEKKDGEGAAARAGQEIDKAAEQARRAMEKAKDAAKKVVNVSLRGEMRDGNTHII